MRGMQNLLLGLDIGGVNIKCSSFLTPSRQEFEKNSFSSKNYFPLWKNTLPELEHEIEEILISVNYNKTHAAKILGIARKTLREKITKYGIKNP